MSKELVKKDEVTALAVPEDLRNRAGQGTEGIGAEDVRPPRIILAQSGHPQTKKNNEKYIQGLAEGDLFNDLTGSIYSQPLRFVVIRRLGKRAAEFWPEEERESHGGAIVKDANIPLSDPRCKPTTTSDGRWVPPVADIFADYLVYLPASTEVVTVTFKNADLGRNGAATILNSLMKYVLNLDGAVLTNPPSWAREFELSSGSKSDGTHDWAVYKVKVVGVAPADVRKIAGELYDQFKAANVVIEAEPSAEEDDEKTPF